jgi:uncharacterized membrane protein YkvA (DUF1232 family)
MAVLEKGLQQKVVKVFADSFAGKAVALMQKRPKALAFVGFVVARFSEVGAQQGLKSFQAIVRMLASSLRGTYPNLPWRMAVGLLGGLLYLATPIDIIPDFIPVLGFMDDAFLLGKIFQLAEQDLQAFLAWERGQIRGREPEGI